MRYREIFTNFYLEQKNEFKLSIKIGIVFLSILMVILLFLTVGPIHNGLIPVIIWIIGAVLFIRKNWKGKQDNEKLGNDTLKRIDNPYKYT